MVNNSQSIDFASEISKFIFTGKYARYDEAKQRRETPDEAVDRLVEMHLKKYSFLPEVDKNEIRWAFDQVRAKKVLPSMRSFQFAGKPIEKNNARIFNCSVRHIDSLRAFSEVFYLLLSGCGVGIGVSKKFVNRLPDLVDASNKTGTVITYSVEDTIEGWADSVEALLNCYHKNTPYSGRKIVFDYSKIRKKGAKLKVSGGKAPGYKGLKNALEKIKEHLDYIIEERYLSHLRPIDVYDILMHCADAVLSGGIRRSATSVIFDEDDIDMITAKISFEVVRRKGTFEHDEERKMWIGKVGYDGRDYEIELKESEYEYFQKTRMVYWKKLFPHRARSNNSVLLLRKDVTPEKFAKIIERTKQYGEPGFVFADNEDMLFNPCFEIGFQPITKDGICGVQFCNLTSINGAAIKTKEDFKLAVKAETIIGTLQAGYTRFPYLSRFAEELTKEESLLGCSITGMMDSPDILLNDKIQKEMAEYAVKINEEWAAKIGINPAARVTCIKPEGTGTLTLGKDNKIPASGAHGHHAKPKFFRRVQCNKIDNVYKWFKKHNPHMCEESVWSENKTDDVITFPILVSDDSLVKDDLTALQHLEIIKNTQQNWVLVGGKNNKKQVDNNVSCTVIVKDDEWDGVIKYICDNKQYFAAVSFISAMGDKLFAQAPMERIVTDEDQKKWDNIIDNMKPVDYTLMVEKDDETHLQQEAACSGGNCEVVTM